MIVDKLWNLVFEQFRSETASFLSLLYPQRAIGEAIINSGAQLEALDLSDNAFGPDGVEAVRELLVSPAGFSLQSLRFHNNGLGPGGGKVGVTFSTLICLLSSVLVSSAVEKTDCMMACHHPNKVTEIALFPWAVCGCHF